MLVFDTLSHATTFIEPWGAEDCSPAFDSEGRLLRVFASNRLEALPADKRPKATSWLPPIIGRFVQRFEERQLEGFKATRIEALEQEPSHQSELREVLIDWLVNVSAWRYEHKRIGTPLTREELSQEPLQRLVERSLEYSV